MPFWPTLPSPEPMAGKDLPVTIVEARVERQTMIFGDALKVEFDQVVYRDSAYVFEGEVVADYLGTRLRTKRLKAFPLERRAECEAMTIDDPEAVITGESLRLDWGAKTGEVKHLRLAAGGVTVRAASANIRPQSWDLAEVEGTSSRRDPPTYRARAQSVSLVPGKQGVARRLVFEFFGVPLGPLPRSTFNLDQRVTGLKIPEFSNKKGVGFGVSWSSSVLVDDRTALFAGVGAFPRQSTGSNFTIARSGLDPTKLGAAIIPRDDLGAFADDGWFSNLLVREPGEQGDLLRARRNSVSLGTIWNAGTTGRLPDASDVSKAFDLAAERGGTVGKSGFGLRARVQRVRTDPTSPWLDRFLVDGTFGPPDLKLSRDISLVSRVDFRGTASRNGPYGFGRVESGLAWVPSGRLAVGVGASYLSTSGTPDFAFDSMPHGSSLSIRGDLREGPVTLRALWRYDLVSREWYDQQYEVALVADGFEPYVASRRFPSDYRVGLRFRLDKFLPRLLQREIKREKPK